MDVGLRFSLEQRRAAVAEGREIQARTARGIALTLTRARPPTWRKTIVNRRAADELKARAQRLVRGWWGK